MKQIKLSDGKIALIDDSDYELVSEYTWHNGAGYAITKRKSFQTSMHRLILGLTDPKILVDHKDHNRLNNQRYNIKPCTVSQNQSNRTSVVGSSSKYLGVYYDNGRCVRRWVAQIGINKKIKKLGRFDTEIEAAIIYNIAARKYHGYFANPNIFS